MRKELLGVFSGFPDHHFSKEITDMKNNPRCLYNNSFYGFLSDTETTILGTLCDNYHGDAKTTTRDAWKGEITVMQKTLTYLGDKDGRVVFE